MIVFRFIMVFLVLQAGVYTLSAQTPYRDQELTIRNDNDVYTFRDSDKYYSNGLITKYRWVTTPGKFLSPKSLSDSSKIIIEAELTQKFYTSRFLALSNFEDFDRPYAGTLTMGYYINTYPSKIKRLRYGLDLTIVGPASGAGAFQTWYHNAVGFPEPKGWPYQIPNELTFNIVGDYQRQFTLVDKAIDLISTTSGSLGTGFTNMRQMLDLRLGRLQPLDRSTFSNSLIGEGSESIIDQVYIYAGIGVEYVIQNITIQGSIWNDSAPHTENIVPWIRHMRFGFVTSSGKSTFKLIYNWLGPEVKNVKWHSYIGLELNVRFTPSKRRRNAYN